MADSQYLSTTAAALALGVSVTTVKRWVDENVLPAHRTAGGHRKVLLEDVRRLVREGRLPCADRRLLGDVPEVPPRPFAADEAEAAFHDALRGGAATVAIPLLLEAHRGGVSVVRLADEVVA